MCWIGLLSGVGGVAVHGEDEQREHAVVTISYGAGLALIVDEFALLLDLKDVFWAPEGRIWVDLGVGGSSLVGTYSPPALLRAFHHQSSQASLRARFHRARSHSAAPAARSSVTVVRKAAGQENEEGSARMTTRIDQFSSPAAVGGGSGPTRSTSRFGDDNEVIVIDPGTDRRAS